MFGGFGQEENVPGKSTDNPKDNKPDASKPDKNKTFKKQFERFLNEKQSIGV